MKKKTSLFRFLLLPLAWLYGMIIHIRHYLFNKGFLKSRSFSTPTINVGNIAIGGTGKTPHIEYLIRFLSDDFSLATLSRGYKRETRDFILAKPEDTYQTIGDEPTQIKLQFPKVQVCVDSDRCNGVSEIEKLDNKPNIILLDDAFQHRYLKVGFNILLTDYQKPYWSNCLIPLGNLRDAKYRAKKADVIIVSKCPKNINTKEQDFILKKIKPQLNQTVCFTRILYGNLKTFSGKDFYSKNKNVSVLMLTGIANPSHLKQHLLEEYKDVETLTFPDHHNFSKNDFDKILKFYERIPSQNKIIITTLKDAVRLKDNINFAMLSSLPLYYQSIKMDFVAKEDQNKFNKLILDYVRKAKRNC